MDIITQNACHRQRKIKYFKNHGATETAMRTKQAEKRYINGLYGMMEV